MPQPTNTYDTFDSIGEREDLEDIIYNISPTETPFMQRAARMNAKAVYHEWQTDSLASAASNAQVEGDDATGNSLSATTRVGNYCQISRKVIVVSGTLDAVDKAGRNTELSYQLAKAGKELKRDMEYALTRNQGSSAGGSATARTLASVESWIATNKTQGTNGTTPGFSSGTVAAPTDDTSTQFLTFTEARLKSVISDVWNEGGDPGVIMVGQHNKQQASGFSGVATLYRDTAPRGQATIIGAADFYVSDFGEHAIVANRFSRDRTALVLDMDYWGVAFLRPIQQMTLSKTGDSEKRLLLGEYTLVSKNEGASGKLADLTTS